MSSFYGKNHAGWDSWETWQPHSAASWNGTTWSSKALSAPEKDGDWWMSSNGSNGSEGWSQGSHGQSWYAAAKKKHASEASALNGTASQGRLVTKEQKEIQEPERPLRAASAPAERPVSRPRTTPEGGGAAALLVEAEHKARGRQRPDRPQPSLMEVQEAADAVQAAQSALLAMEENGDNGQRPKEKEHKEARKRLAQAYQKALRRCAFCPGKELDALKWLEDFEDFGETSRTEKADDLSLTYITSRHEDHPEWRPDVPDYLAALQVCEATQQPLERVWTLLLDLRKKGLDMDSSCDRDRKEIEAVRQKLAKKEQMPKEVEETFEELERQLKDAQEAVAYAEFLASPDPNSALQQHAERWLLPAAHPRAVAAVLRLGSLLQRTGGRADLGAAVRRLGVLPILEAFHENPQRLTLVQDLGLFTPEALRSLGIHTISENGSESAWRQEAARAVHRQAMLRRWSSWNEAQGPGSFAWLAYDLSSQFEQFRCDGEVVGRAPKSPTVSEELPPSLEQDKRPDHAERRALMLLAEKLLQGFSEGGCDCIEVRGVLMLYTPFPPETASIFAMLQFLQLFPWVEMHVAYDDAVDLSRPGGVERIRCAHKELKVEALNGNHGKP